MNEEKRQQIFEALQGITYLEWLKLRHAIDKSFASEITEQTNKVEIATSDKLDGFMKLL